jgi:membrane associated rhomboid family serine protease
MGAGSQPVEKRMFVPIHDANSFRYIKRSYVNLAIIGLNLLVFFAMLASGSEDFSNASVLGLGYIPSVINDTVELDPRFVLVPESLNYFTYAFLHADVLHLGGNMLFLWVFGDNIEDAMGHLKYLIFYLACAAAGAFLHGVILSTSEQPLIGASGAIAGVVVAYLMLHPHVKLWVLAFMRIPLRIPAYIPIALWIAFQVLMLFVQTDDQISWPAHVGGIIAGAILVPFLKRRSVRLFDRPAVEVVGPANVAPATVKAQREPDSSVKWGRQ